LRVVLLGISTSMKSKGGTKSIKFIYQVDIIRKTIISLHTISD
jgi:hypothetical protein